MANKRIIALWFVTGLMALFLLAATISIAQRANQIDELGFTGYVSGVNSVIYLRSRPSSAGAIVTILNLGQAVQVVGQLSDGGSVWYQVEAGENRGWLPIDRITTEPPQGE